MAQIKIRVGAVRDRSVDAVFSSIETRAIRSANVIRRAMQGAVADGLGKGARGGRGPGSGGMSPEEREAKRIADAKIREERRVQREIERNARWRQAMQNRHFQQEAAQRLRSRQRESATLGSRAWTNFKERTSHRATRFLTPNAPIGSMATRALGDFARGAGVDFSIAGSVSRAVGLERAAINLSNSGYQRGQAGPNGQRVDPRELVAQARGVAETYGLDAADALEGIAQFQKITGDLDTGRKMLDGMAKLSAATGTNLSDMAAAAANVSNGLGDIPNKAAVIDKVMRTIAGQGKLGAVEISDLATQMARVAASAGQFTGDRAANIEKMGALAQIARATGGAPSAAEAARSVVGFANTLKKSARINEFKAAGINVFADEGKTSFKDPIELIKESLLATGGDLQKMNKLFMDVIGARGVAGLAKTFSGAGGGKEGIVAVEKELARLLKGAALTQEEIDESARRASESAAAKAARFQNQLDRIVEKVATDLIPALEKAGPSILEFAELIGDIAKWSVENPYSAIAVAIGAATVRAAVESAFRAGVETLLDRSRGVGGNAATPTVGGGGLMGGIGTALSIAGLAIATVQIANAVIDTMVAKEIRDENKEAEKREKEAQRIREIYKRVQEEKMTPEQAKSMFGEVGEQAARKEMSKDTVLSLERSDERKRGGLTGESLFMKLEKTRGQNEKDLENEFGKSQAGQQLLDALRGNLKVTVVNFDQFPAPKGDGGGDGVDRTSPPMPGGSGRN